MESLHAWTRSAARHGREEHYLLLSVGWYPRNAIQAIQRSAGASRCFWWVLYPQLYDFPDLVWLFYQSIASVIDNRRHRPYLSLCEQVLYASIQDIASKFTGPNNAKYVAAANDFRMPYYDWVALPSGFPSALSAATVSVIDRNGPRQMANPLASFQFHPLNPSPGDFSASWSRFPATARYPDSRGNSRNSQVASAISTMTAALRTSVAVALAFQNYNAFSNNRWLQNQRAGEYGSVENIHGE